MSGSVLASIIQNCKARNKCFTSSPQDATPVQGLHSSVHRAQTGAKRGGGGEGREETGGQERRSGGGESERVSCISKHRREILKMLAAIHCEDPFLPGGVFEDAGDALNAIHP